jgi:hypothetical protein
MPSTSIGCEDPENICVCRIVVGVAFQVEGSELTGTGAGGGENLGCSQKFVQQQIGQVIGGGEQRHRSETNIEQRKEEKLSGQPAEILIFEALEMQRRRTPIFAAKNGSR